HERTSRARHLVCRQLEFGCQTFTSFYVRLWKSCAAETPIEITRANCVCDIDGRISSGLLEISEHLKIEAARERITRIQALLPSYASAKCKKATAGRGRLARLRHGSSSLEGYAQHKWADCTELLHCCYSADNGFVTNGLLDHKPNF